MTVGFLCRIATTKAFVVRMKQACVTALRKSRKLKRKVNRMRLIDADAMIDKYGEWYTEEGTDEGFIGTLESVVDMMPTIEPQKWIPVSERMPEVGRDVLITKEPLKIKGYEQEVIIAKRSVDPRSGKIEWWSEFGSLKDKAVLAWMPLPEPWKGEQHETDQC